MNEYEQYLKLNSLSDDEILNKLHEYELKTSFGMDEERPDSIAEWVKSKKKKLQKALRDPQTGLSKIDKWDKEIDLVKDTTACLSVAFPKAIIGYAVVTVLRYGLEKIIND